MQHLAARALGGSRRSFREKIWCRPGLPRLLWWPHLLYSLTSVLRRCPPVEEWLQSLPCRGSRSTLCQPYGGALHSGHSVALT